MPRPSTNASTGMVDVRLADALRARVRTLHTQAERSGIVADVLRGQARGPGYLLLLRNLLPVYQALESSLEQHRGSPLLGELVRPELYRSAAIVADLRGRDLALLPEAAAYADAVAACGAGDGRRLIAHAYARYLGDLNGGKLLQRRVPGALRFHQFPGVADSVSYRAGYRAAIDRAGARLQYWQAVEDEAAEAFVHNIALGKAVKRRS